MKHQKYLSTKPPTYAALERRIDELSKPGHALRELAVQLNAEADKTREAFKRTPTCQNARTWFDAYVAKKEFAEGQFIQGAHSEESHAQSALRRDQDSFAIYLPILAKVADLLGEDIEDARAKIRKSLAEIEAEVDPDSVKPLPALRAKLEHVQTLIDYSAIPARRTDSLVDQINAVINGNPKTLRISRNNLTIWRGGAELLDRSFRIEQPAITEHGLRLNPKQLDSMRQGAGVEIDAASELRF